MTKKKLFVWTCDYSENSGEGRLARLFIKKLNQKNKFYLRFNQKKILKQKYISTLFGIIYCWNKYFKKEKVCYLNYLPFWNFLIFAFLPPNTILGPITGGADFSSSNIFNKICRGLIFPIFYKISEFFINLRNTKIIFSTNLLKKFLYKKTIKKSDFNFVIKNFLLENKFKKKKKIDFIIYYRKHKNKESFFPHELIKKLKKLNFKIYVIGDKLTSSPVKNFGFINNKKVNNLQSQAKYTISSGENLYSFFILECLLNGVKIIIEKDIKRKITFFKQNFIKIDFKSFNDISKLK